MSKSPRNAGVSPRGGAVGAASYSSEDAKAASVDREGQWVLVQIKGLSAWVNSYLTAAKRKEVTKLENLEKDLQNGVKLNQFVELLSGAKLRYDNTPKMKIQCIQNLNTALQYIQADLAVRLVGIGAEDLYAGNVKLILGLLWSMFRALRISQLANELGDAGKSGSEAQQLIAWVQKQVAPAPYQLKVADWSDFRDGKAFAGLLNLYDDSFLDWKSVGDNGLENLERAFKGFETHLAIPQLISPKEVFDGTADERSLTLYTSLIYHAHATAAERLRLKREAMQKDQDLDAQRRAAEEARLRNQQMGGELELLRAENERLLQRALAAEELARKAFSALDVLRRNLLEHLDDLGQFKELNEIDLDPAKLTVYDEKKVNAQLAGKQFDVQVDYLAKELQAENRTLTRMLRVKDSKRDIEDTVFKSATLYTKGGKGDNWVQQYFRLMAEDLVYFADEKSAAGVGSVSLREPGTTVTLLKPEQSPSGDQLFPIKLKLSNGQQFYVATITKKDRKDWAAIINGRVVHFEYLKKSDEEGVRPDTRVVNLCNAPADCPSVYLDNGSLSDSSLEAIAAILPFLERVNVVSFTNTELDDANIALLGEGLSKGSFRILKLTSNRITDSGAQTLATLLANNKTVEELDMSNNQIGDAGVAALSALLQKTLNVLNIEGNNTGDKGIASLCIGLKTNGVPILRFAENSIGDEGAAAIGALIKESSNIIEVQLGKNHITDAGVAVLCEALKQNKSVLKLDLSENSIGPAGVASLHELLKTNRIIGSIDVSGNKEIVEGAALAKALQYEGLTLASLTFSRYGL